MHKIILLFITIFFFKCSSKHDYQKLKLDSNQIGKLQKKVPLSEKEKKEWYIKDVLIDSIPGISLDRVYDSILVNHNNEEGKEIIIAILDSEIDIDHEELKNNIWENIDEIPGNGIDDDNNGYIDDVYGWNFLGNSKGDNNNFTSYEYTRYLKKYNSNFKGKKYKEIEPQDSILFRNYLRAIDKYESQLKYAKEDLEYGNMLSSSMKNVKKEIAKFISYTDYTIKDLDSLKNIFPNNKELQEAIIIRSNFIKYSFTQNYIDNYKLNAEERINKLLNLKFDDRKITGDDSEDINDINYGNSFVNKNINLFTHGTEVAGTILNLKNKNVKIMPVCVSPMGDEHDKDIALGIRYAVDNGAKVINMSFGKEFSLHTEWVFDAFKYAEKHNVLIVSSCGNSKYNLTNYNDYYPNDNINNGKEVCDNFILVGGITNNLSKKILYRDSNYGSIDVDVFAPADDIYTTTPNNGYKLDSGTSLASAITSGVAGLIYSYYPNLTASQVKHILMNSGLEYTFEVATPTKEDKKKTTPFNKLSKSGKVLNAYNAFIMADSISRK